MLSRLHSTTLYIASTSEIETSRERERERESRLMTKFGQWLVPPNRRRRHPQNQSHYYNQYNGAYGMQETEPLPRKSLYIQYPSPPLPFLSRHLLGFVQSMSSICMYTNIPCAPSIHRRHAPLLPTTTSRLKTPLRPIEQQFRFLASTCVLHAGLFAAHTCCRG